MRQQVSRLYVYGQPDGMRALSSHDFSHGKRKARGYRLLSANGETILS
jgi:hypothetical protein